jgi:hypothetical protein
MVTGIDASITSITDGTTAHASDVIASLNSLNSNGVSNDSGLITTDNAGGLTVVSVSNAQGIIRGMFALTTPYLLYNGGSINNSIVDTKTCTGVGEPVIPSGTKFVLISFFYVSSTVGAFLLAYPHGATVSNNSNYPLLSQIQVSNQSTAGTAIVPLDSGGQMDIKASGNCTSINMSIYGYIY